MANSAPAGWIFIKFGIWGFFRKYAEKIQVLFKSDKSKGCFTRMIFVFLDGFCGSHVLLWRICEFLECHNRHSHALLCEWKCKCRYTFTLKRCDTDSKERLCVPARVAHFAALFSSQLKLQQSWGCCVKTLRQQTPCSCTVQFRDKRNELRWIGFHFIVIGVTVTSSSAPRSLCLYHSHISGIFIQW